MNTIISTCFVLLACAWSIPAVRTPKCNNSACNFQSDCGADQFCRQTSGACGQCAECCDTHLLDEKTCEDVCGHDENPRCLFMGNYNPSYECYHDTKDARSSCSLVEEVRLIEAQTHAKHPLRRCFYDYSGGDYDCKPSKFSEVFSACKALGWGICQMKHVMFQPTGQISKLPTGSISGSISVYYCLPLSCAGAYEQLFFMPEGSFDCAIEADHSFQLGAKKAAARKAVEGEAIQAERAKHVAEKEAANEKAARKAAEEAAERAANEKAIREAVREARAKYKAEEKARKEAEAKREQRKLEKKRERKKKREKLAKQRNAENKTANELVAAKNASEAIVVQDSMSSVRNASEVVQRAVQEPFEKAVQEAAAKQAAEQSAIREVAAKKEERKLEKMREGEKQREKLAEKRNTAKRPVNEVETAKNASEGNTAVQGTNENVAEESNAEEKETVQEPFEYAVQEAVNHTAAESGVEWKVDQETLEKAAEGRNPEFEQVIEANEVVKHETAENGWWPVLLIVVASFAAGAAVFCILKKRKETTVDL